ncbi:unnamed protein product, partial [Prorocentrum cordatum]
VGADGLDCETIEHGPDVARLAGLDLHRASGRISVGHVRCWKIRLALFHALADGRASGPGMRSLLGHCTLSAIHRRLSLSLPRERCRFVDRAGLGRVPLWPSVRRRLERVAPLPPLARVAANRPWLDCVAAADSEGDNLVDDGGSDVARKFHCAEQARLAQLRSRPPPAPRRRPPPSPTASRTLTVGVTFSHVDQRVIGDFSSQQLSARGRCVYSGPLPLLQPVIGFAQLKASIIDVSTLRALSLAGDAEFNSR